MARRMRGRSALFPAFLSLAAASGALALALPASAEEPVSAREPRFLKETAEITSVVDAFDDDDPFDLHLTLGFEQSWKSASIRRETYLNQGGLSGGGFVPATENIASFSQAVSTLNLGAAIGIYKDLALSLRLPFILSDTRSLDDLNGSSRNPQRLQDTNGDQLFSVPFKSPSRSGVDWFGVGLDYAIMNQMRDFTKPTWVVGVEGRFGVGTPLHACNDSPGPGLPQCPDPLAPKDAGRSRDPGISRGMTSLEAHTAISRRFGYVEPYSGLSFLAEFPHDGTDMGNTDGFKGSLVNHPPLLGKFFLGAEVTPWERRERFQRLVFDGRFVGAYHSPGREYSELFDALGSSQAGTLRTPNPGGYHLNPADGVTSVADPAQQQVFFTGITEQQAYGSFTAMGGVTYQAGEFVKFNAGMGFTFNQSHLISGADSCNPDFNKDPAAAGPCHSVTNGGAGPQNPTGIPNPNHRDVIDLPGHRFSVDNATIVNLWVNGIVMF